MNQYERIVSYIYQYYNGKKGANVGYAKVEKRGKVCRIGIQMRALAIQQTPQVYLFIQRKNKIQTIPIGEMVAKGSNLVYKGSTESEDIFESGIRLEEMDGIFIYVEEGLYFTSMWSEEKFILGEWNKEEEKAGDVQEKERNTAGEATEEKTEEAGEHKETVEIAEKPAGENKRTEEMTEKTEAENKTTVEMTEKPAVKNKTTEEMTEKPAVENKTTEEPAEKSVVEERGEETSTSGEAVGEIETNEVKAQEMEMKSVCGVCPFKKQKYDYGKKILMTFPSMKPFSPEVAKACVKMELQDLGCLPIASWSLSGNRFLLHGYYCYRHLLFAQMADGRYVLGVPGIYNEKDHRNAKRYGFDSFCPIGNLKLCQGAFGYWLMEVAK